MGSGVREINLLEGLKNMYGILAEGSDGGRGEQERDENWGKSEGGRDGVC